MDVQKAKYLSEENRYCQTVHCLDYVKVLKRVAISFVNKGQ